MSAPVTTRLVEHFRQALCDQPMIPPDFTLEYVALCLSVDEDNGLIVWTTDFQAALDSWDLPRCTRLLQIAKSQVQSEMGWRLVKYAEGQYADQGGDWPRAIRCVERIDIYLETFLKSGQRTEAIRFCQILQPSPEGVESAEWQPIQAYFSELEAALSNGDVAADTSAG